MPAPDVLPATRPALVTIPAVPVLSVGTWSASTGVFTVGSDDLHAAVAAFDDPAYHRPRLRLGHGDGELATEPAIGRLINPRVTDDGMTLVVDIAGVPAWLADIAATAFPSRSIEGEFRHKTGTGTTHRFALTALSLLGVEAPAVSTLADLATLFGLDPVAVAASAADSLEEHMPESVTVAASVNLDTVRQQWYSPENASLRETLGGSSWCWIREVYTDFVIADDDEGHLFRVPWSESPDVPGQVVWGEPTQVRVEYIDQPAAVAASAGTEDALRRGSLRARLAAMAAPDIATPEPPNDPTHTPSQGESAPAVPASAPTEPPAPVSAPETPAAEPVNPPIQEDQMALSTDVLQRLGLADGADNDAVNAAILAALNAKPTTDPEDDDEADDAAEPNVAQKELVAASAQYATELKRLSTELAEIKAREASQVKASVLDGAQQQGKFTPAERPKWEQRYDQAPAVTTDILASIAAGAAVPVAASGYTGSAEPQVSDDDLFKAFFSPTDNARLAQDQGV